MCVLFVAFRRREDMPLVVAANRDEFYDRPTAPASVWEGTPAILAGRDLRAGGTWLGITRSGRWAALTNVRGPEAPAGAPSSRGMLPLQFLKGEARPERFLLNLAGQSEGYAPFNLLVGTSTEVAFFSSQERSVRLLEPGLYGLSNQSLDSPWPKVTRGAEAFRELIERPEAVEVELLFAAMRDETPAPDHLLPDTGIGVELERLLSPIFIAGERYGTRSSTVMTLDADEVCLRERRFGPRGESAGSSAHALPRLRAR